MCLTPLSKDEIDCRITKFIAYVQSDLQHHSFLPGYNWWVVMYSNTCVTQIPNAVSFLEQLVITPADMECHYGPHWNYSIEKTFASLHVQQYIKSILYVSPKGIDDFDFNLTPNHDNIITKSAISIKNRAWMKLQQEIIHASHTYR